MSDIENTNPGIQFYASVISGGLLLISELLPYISSIKGNGIIQVLTNTFNRYDEAKKKTDEKIDQILTIVQKIQEHLKL